MMKNVCWSSCKVPAVVLFYLNEAWVSSTDFRKILKHHISRTFVRWQPSCSMGTDGRTDGRAGVQTNMTKLIIVAFHNFAKGP